MNKPALVGIHRGKLDHATTLTSLRGGIPRHGLHLVATAALVALDVHDNGVVEADTLGEHGGKHDLECIERDAMTTDEDGKVPTVHVEDQLTLVTIILINRTIVLTKATQDGAKDGDGRIGNGIYLVIRKLAS